MKTVGLPTNTRKAKKAKILFDLINENGYTRYVELGVAGGYNMSCIIQNADVEGFEAYGVDPFITYGEYGDDMYNKKDMQEKSIKRTAERIFHFPNYTHYHEFSHDAVSHFKKNSVGLVFIDANHTYEYVKRDIDLWYPIVEQGGILSGHDYNNNPKHVGVKEAVHEFIEDTGLELILKPFHIWLVRKPTR